MRILLFLLLFIPLFADDEIIVHLTTQESLTPIVVLPLDGKESDFDSSYVASLDKVLRFDFEHNGKTELAAQGKQLTKIEGAIKKKALKIKVTNGLTRAVKGVEGITLTGKLNLDRQLIHKAHDAIFESLFNEKGIAQTQLIYAQRNRKSTQSTEWISDVWAVDYDGGNARQITHESSLCVTPIFVPTTAQEKCSNFVYVSYKIGQPKIYASSLQEGIGQRLLFLSGNQFMPALSPTLDKMAFVSDVTGNPDLFVQDFSIEKGLIGKPRQVFCAPGATQGTPSFSPDGKKLAFVSNKDGKPRIYIMDIPRPGASLKEIKPVMITKKTRENTAPSWSPDGKKIAYSALTGGTRQIWIYDLSSKEEIQLTDGYGHKENPAWAPNSQHLVFNSTTENKAELFIIHLNQKKVTQITQGPGEKRFPAWESFTNFEMKRKI